MAWIQTVFIGSVAKSKLCKYRNLAFFFTYKFKCSKKPLKNVFVTEKVVKIGPDPYHNEKWVLDPNPNLNPDPYQKNLSKKEKT